MNINYLYTNNLFDARGIVKITGEQWTFFHSENAPFFNDKPIEIMDVDEEGRVYVLNDESLYFYDENDWNLLAIPDLVADVNESYSKLRFDHNNHPWLFNYFGYIFQYTGTEWVIFEPEVHGNVSGYFNGVAFDNENELWFGTYSGLFHFDGTTWTAYSTFGLSNIYIRDLKIGGNGNVWIAGTNGISKFDGASFTSYLYTEMGLTNNSTFYSLEIDNEGHIWAGSLNTLVEFDGLSWEIYNTLNSGLPNQYTVALAEDDYQNMWIGTGGAGFAIFNKDGIQTEGEHTANYDLYKRFPLSVYPTIADKNTTLSIEIPDKTNAKFGQIGIIDTFGKLIFRNKILLNQPILSIDLSNLQLSSGTYFINLMANKKMFIRKIVVIDND